MILFSQKRACLLSFRTIQTNARSTCQQGNPARLEVYAMLRYALLFALISIVAGILGFSGISAATAGIAKIFFFIAIAIFLLFVILAITGINLLS